MSFIKSIRKAAGLSTRKKAKFTHQGKTKNTSVNMTKERLPSLKNLKEARQFAVQKAQKELQKAKDRKKIENKYKGLSSVKIGTKTDLNKAQKKYNKRKKQIKSITKTQYNKRRMSPAFNN